jgi:alpha-glucuronidase
VAKEATAALAMNFVKLKPEGFLIKTGRFRNRPVVVVAGNDGISTMYVRPMRILR